MTVLDATNYVDLYENAPCGFLSADGAGTILRINETLLRWLHQQRDAVLGTPFVDLLEEDGRSFYDSRQLPALLEQGELREIALRLQRPDGTVLPVLANAVVVDGDAGQPAELRFALFDATERQQYERELIDARRVAEMSSERVRALQDATTAFTASETEEEVIEALAEAVRAAVGATAVAAVAEDPDGSLRIVGGRHLLDEVAPGARWPIYDQALATMEHVAIARVAEADEQTALAMRAAGIESFTALPVRNDAGVRGLIVSFFNRERELSEAAVDLKLSITKQAMQALKSMRLQRQLEQLALYDELTGLANRKLLQEQLTTAIASTMREASSLGLMFIDLDGFKAVNDQLGHDVGDSVLREVAERLTAVVRQNDLVGRLGGDEFVVICETLDEGSALLVAERITEAVRAPYEGVPAPLGISASVGVVLTHPTPGSVPSGDSLLVRADAAMYRSKNDGRDRVTVELV